MTLGRIIVDLLARTGSFDTDINRSAKLAEKRAREIDAAFRRAGKAIGTALGVGAVAAATTIGLALKSSIDRMDEMRDASIRLGIGVETLSAFAFAAKQTGTDIEALGTGFKILAKNMADALNPKSGKAQIFESLGIKVQDATGHLKSFEQIIPEIADKFRLLEDGTTKAALAQELFGKSGLQLTEFLNQGGEGIQALTDKARELGLVISQDAADAADQFKDKLGELKAVGEGLAIKLAEHLLPKLEALVDWAIAFSRDGDNAKRAAEALADGFDTMVAGANFAWKVLQTLSATTRGVTSDMIGLFNAMMAVGKARTFQFGDAQEYMKNAATAFEMGQEQSQRIKDIWTDVAKEQKKAMAFAGVTAKVSGPGLGDNIDRKALNNALGGFKPTKSGGGGAKKSGKSDEEREAERLQQAYDRQNDSLKEQIALFGQDGEAAKLRYALEFGELAKLDPLKKAELLARAETIDLMKAEREQYEESMEVEKRAAEEKLRGIEATDAMIRDMQFELELLGMTNKERERAIALRMADANATEEQRAAIAQLSDSYHEAAKVADFWLEAQNGISDALFDTVTRAKSAEDAVKGFFDNMARYITRMISDGWAEKIANTFANMGGGASGSAINPITGGTVSSGGGGGGSWWASLLGALLGGGRAAGGPVFDGGAYLVGEHGPEMFMPRTSGTVIPARQTQQAFRPSGGVTINNHFSQRPDRRTLEQASRDMGRNARRGMQRTG